MNSMHHYIRIATGAIVLFGLPSAAHAHGQFLQGISDTVAAELGEPACELPAVTCGLCHQPNEGDRLENVVVSFGEIDVADRNGPFYDALRIDAGWDHQPHAMDMNAHRDANLMLLMDEALPVMVADDIDSDMDGVPDLVELWLGYNPLLPYEVDDPELSKLCDAAQPFPDDGGDTDTDGGDTDTDSGGTDTDGGDTDTDGGGTDTDGGDTDTTTGSGESTTTGSGESTTTGSGESTSDTGLTVADSTDDTAGDVGSDSDTTGAAAEDDGGCSCSSATDSGRSVGLLALLGLFALSLRRRSPV